MHLKVGGATERKKIHVCNILFIKGVNVGMERWLSGQRACGMSMDLSLDPQHLTKTGHDSGFLQLQHWVMQTRETGLCTN